MNFFAVISSKNLYGETERAMQHAAEEEFGDSPRILEKFLGLSPNSFHSRGVKYNSEGAYEKLSLT